MVSEGCRSCYAMRLAGGRLKDHPSRRGLTKATARGPVWTGEVRFNKQWLDQPHRWQRPRMVFVCAHADLFHESVPNDWIDQIFAVMACSPQHIFQVLTKRPERMARYLNALDLGRLHFRGWGVQDYMMGALPALPLPNVWIGTSVESESYKAHRCEALLDSPAKTRWLSVEPMIGPLALSWLEGCGDCDRCLHGRRDLCHAATWNGYLGPQSINWVVVGGESGRGARPMEHEWAVRVVRDCIRAGVPVFVKQLSQANFPHSYKDYDAFPETLRVRQYPTDKIEA